jgi:hypothetical protein
MGKATYKGLVPSDDPMFSGGPQMFSRPESKPSSMTSASDTTGATPEQSSSFATEAMEAELPKTLRKGIAQSSTAAKLSRSRNDAEDIEFATEVLNELAVFDESFRYTVRQPNGIDGNIQNAMPDAKFLGDVTAEDEKSQSGADKKYMFKSADGSLFYVYESGNKVWLDVSRFSEGNRGSAIYHGVANYAHNTGKVFIGDPAGLSEVAIVRRTSAMLSSAFRFGTTKHFEPAKEKLAGVPDKGVVPLKWSADDYKNIQSLVKTFIENLQTKFPEIKGYSYDFGRNTIVDRRGRPVDTTGLGLGAVSPGGRASRAGSTTLRQGIFIQSLASSESGKRPKLLEQFLRGALQLAQSSRLSGLFSRSRVAGALQSPDVTQSRRRPQVKENIFSEPVLSNWTTPEVTNKDKATRYLQD